MSNKLVDQFRAIEPGKTKLIVGKRTVLYTTKNREQKNGKRFSMELPEEETITARVTRKA